MVKQNLAQHEQYLKSLEFSLNAICDQHKVAYDAINESWNMAIKLFVIADDLRKNRLALE